MKILPVLLIMAALAACGPAPGPATAAQDSTPAADMQQAAPADTTVKTSLEGEWKLQPVLPSDTAAGKIPLLVFDLTSSKFQGNTGCNTMRGSFYLSGDSLAFDEQMVMTRMACPGYNEQVFVENLTKTNRYKIENGVLELMQEQTILSKWIRKDSTVQKKI